MWLVKDVWVTACELDGSEMVSVRPVTLFQNFDACFYDLKKFSIQK